MNKPKLYFLILYFLSIHSLIFSQSRLEIRGESAGYYMISEECNNKRFVRFNLKGTEQERVEVLDIPQQSTNVRYRLHINGTVTYFYIRDKSNLTLDVDGKCLTYSGDDAEINNYLYNWSMSAYNDCYNMLVCCHAVLPKLMMPVPSNEQLFSVDNRKKIFTKEKREREILSNSKITDKTFLDEQNLIIKYQNQLIKLSTINFALDEETTLSEEELTFLKSIKFQDSNLLNYSDWQGLLSTYFSAMKKTGILKDGLYSEFNQDLKLIEDRKVRDSYALAKLGSIVRVKQIFGVDELIGSVAKDITDPKSCKSLKELQQTHEQNKLEFPGKGENFFKGELLNHQDQPINIEEYKGAYIYVDFWATWCSPCRQMTKYFKELNTKYQNKNIKFLMISVDNVNMSKVVNEYITRNKLEDICYRITDRSVWDQFYKVKAIPRFMLISPEGKVISSQFLWPNNLHIESYLDSLL